MFERNVLKQYLLHNPHKILKGKDVVFARSVEIAALQHIFY